VVNDHEIGIARERLSCACGYLEKTGIPCSHSIKLIVDLKEDCLNYIHKRWHLKIAKEAEKYQTHRGRSKKTRRNRK
jgi:hypothetical protein